MDFGELLGATWRVTWKHKYLWILGLFALTLDGCSSGPNANFNLGSGDFQFDGSGPGVPGDVWIWVAIAGLVLLVGAVLFVISVMAAGGLVAGCDEAYRQVPSRGLRSAWRRGVARFWHLLGLLIVVALLAFVVFIAIGLLVGVPIAILVLSGDGPSVPAVIGIVIIGLVAVLLLIFLAIVTQIVLSWSYRSLILDDTGVLASLGAGWRLFRDNLGISILVWAVAFGLGLAAGLIIGIPLLALLVPAILAIGIFGDSGTNLLPLALTGGLVVIIIGILLKAFGSTFFTAYWTIAYRRLAERSTKAIGNGTEPPRPGQSPVAPTESA